MKNLAVKEHHILSAVEAYLKMMSMIDDNDEVREVVNNPDGSFCIRLKKVK